MSPSQPTGLCQPGQVVALTAEYALIQLRNARCAQCPGAVGCRRSSLFRDWFGGAQSPLPVPRGDLRLGQLVGVEVAPAQLLAVALMTYGRPLLGLLLGLSLAGWLGAPSWAAGLAGLIAMALATLGRRPSQPLALTAIGDDRNHDRL